MLPWIILVIAIVAVCGTAWLMKTLNVTPKVAYWVNTAVGSVLFVGLAAAAWMEIVGNKFVTGFLLILWIQRCFNAHTAMKREETKRKRDEYNKRWEN